MRRAPLVAAEPGGEVDRVVEAGQSHGDVGRAAADVLDDITVGVA